MTSIWGVLIQTIHVSFIAVIILFLKWLFKDKLSPRWQYEIWSVLIVSILIPVGYFHVYIIPQFNILFETIKVMVEKLLSSSYIKVYELIYNRSIIPIIQGKPQSITDYLLIIYTLGLVICLFIYIVRYIKMRRALKLGKPASQETMDRIKRICDKYHLKECQIVVLDQLPSPFVFGVIHPILVLPSEKVVDDKVLLHELLHLKYMDSLQSMGWFILRAFHWFNPFINSVFQTIHNDMESLCDQRVLELLEGEERREYGKILLSMTSDKYPSYFGTTSISNGAQFIKERIEAIVRFKKYPKGMKLVSLCMIVLLLPLAIGGTVSMTCIDVQAQNEFIYELSMASARMYHCPTIATAIDVYAKGLLTSNDLYIVSTMLQNQQHSYKEVLKSMPQNITSNNHKELYRVSGMTKINENEYRANLLFWNESQIENFNPETNRPYFEINGMVYYFQYTLVPIRILNENGWKVEQNGEMIRNDLHDIRYNAIDYQVPYQTIVKEIGDISLQMDVYSYQYILPVEYSGSTYYTNYTENSVIYGTKSQFSYEPISNAIFTRSYQKINVTLDYNFDNDDYIKLSLVKLNSLEDKADFTFAASDDLDPIHVSVGSSTNEGAFYIFDKDTPPFGPQVLYGHFENEEFLCDNEPQYFALQVIHNGEIIDEIRFEVKGDKK